MKLKKFLKIKKRNIVEVAGLEYAVNACGGKGIWSLLVDRKKITRNGETKIIHNLLKIIERSFDDGGSYFEYWPCSSYRHTYKSFEAAHKHLKDDSKRMI